MAGAESFDVQVAYARPDRQRVLTVRVSDGASAAQAVRQSGLLDEFPEIVLAEVRLGIFGRRVALSQPVRPGDRVEIYRALQADPKAVRRERAGRSKTVDGR